MTTTSSTRQTTADYTNRKITGQFIGQIYRNDNDDFPHEKDPVAFDATEAVLSLDFDSVCNLINDQLDDEDLDNLVPDEVRDAHGGPFAVRELEGSTRQFFGLEWDETLAAEEYEMAREAHGIGQLKSYVVMVERTETRHVWLEVEGTDSQQARRAALDQAGDVDFHNEGSASDPVYSIDQIHALRTMQDEQLDSAHPRPKG